MMTRSPILAATFAALLLAGCTPPDVRPQLGRLDAKAVGLPEGASLPVATRWWSAFGDPQLDRIMADTLAANPSLASALARIRVAEAQLGAERADLLPQVTGSAEEQRTRLSEKYIIPPPYGGSTRWVGSAAANLSWSLDLFGRQAAMVEQARANVDAAALDAAAARLALTGAVAQTYVELTRAEQLSALAGDYVASRRSSLRLVQSRVRNQLASQFDIRAAETLLAQAEQAKVRAEADRETRVHALAALAGRGADYYPTIARTSLAFDRALPLPATLPADLLGRRPDLLAGQARIASASAGREVAGKAFYPNIDLLGSFGVQAIGLGNLFSGGALTYGAGPSIHLPIFEGGKLKANYKGATAQVDVAITGYDDAVLRAVRDASDAISQVRANADDAVQQAKIVGGLRDVVRLDRTRIENGLGSQLDILDSGTRLLVAQQDAVNIAASGAIRRVQLLVAIGGDFDPQTISLAAKPANPEARP
jgi:NodT family efflux transporter outer membrane factor (OMF) lipoprotein